MKNRRPSDREIKDQLQLVLKSPGFASSERLKNFLEYVVEETLGGRGDKIKAYSVAVDLFDLGLDFDSSLNPSVRVAAGRLRNKLEHYYFTSKNEDKVKITIPKGGYLPSFSRLSGPRQHDDKEMEPEPPVLELMEAEAGQGNVAGNRPTVIVMPFKSLSEQEHLKEFLAGLSEEIAIALTRFDELSVVNIQPRGGKEPDLWETAEKINARFIVGGSAQVGGGMKTTACGCAFTLWTAPARPRCGRKNMMEP